MDYEKKYKEALERAQKFEEKYGGGYAALIFPELAVSEELNGAAIDFADIVPNKETSKE